jgi:hypothetical protein
MRTRGKSTSRSRRLTRTRWRTTNGDVFALLAVRRRQSADALGGAGSQGVRPQAALFAVLAANDQERRSWSVGRFCLCCRCYRRCWPQGPRTKDQRPMTCLYYWRCWRPRTNNQGPRTKGLPVLLAVLAAKDLSVLLAVLAPKTKDQGLPCRVRSAQGKFKKRPPIFKGLTTASGPQNDTQLVRKVTSDWRNHLRLRAATGRWMPFSADRDLLPVTFQRSNQSWKRRGVNFVPKAWCEKVSHALFWR